MLKYIPLLGCVLLTACGPSGTSVFDANGNRVGRVEVLSASEASVYDNAGNKVGTIENDRVENTSGNKVGSVKTDHRILNNSDSKVGKMRGDGTTCENNSTSKVGAIASVIDNEAAGGACLLLLL